MGVVDMHVHLLAAMEFEKALLREMERAGVELVVLLTMDLNPSVLRKEEVRSKLIQRYKKTRAYEVDPTRWNEEEFMRYLENFFHSFRPPPTHQYLASFVESFPKLAVGIGSINPLKPTEYVEEKLREIAKLRLKGVKVLPTLQLFDPATNQNFELICEFCERNKLLLICHTGCDPGPFELPELSQDANPERLVPVLERYSVNIVLAHLGSYSVHNPRIWLTEALEILKRFENAYADTSAVNYALFYREDVVERIRRLGLFEKLLFGSDFPYIRKSNIAYEVRGVRESRYLTEEEKEAVLRGNALKLLRKIGAV